MDETNTLNIKNPLANKDLGMDPIFTRQIAIEGMTCDKCVERVDKALRKEPGVKEVKVDRQHARATVVFDSTQTDIPRLHDALGRAGYRATRRADEE